MPYNKISGINPYAVSQNFLTSKWVLKRIIALSSITKADTVIEIGTGKGHLADVLASKCKTLHTIEIDRSLYHQAQRRLQPRMNIRLTLGNFLYSALPKHKAYKIFANIPFSITSKIIQKCTTARTPPTDMWLTMEKGIAKRFLGEPKETQQSLLLKPKWNLQIVYRFRRDDFHPRPSVDVVLVHFSRKVYPDIPPEQWNRYQTFITHALTYGIITNKSLLTKRQTIQALKQAGLTSNYQDGVTLYIQWLCLFRHWLAIHKTHA